MSATPPRQIKSSSLRSDVDLGVVRWRLSAPPRPDGERMASAERSWRWVRGWSSKVKGSPRHWSLIFLLKRPLRNAIILHRSRGLASHFPLQTCFCFYFSVSPFVPHLSLFKSLAYFHISFSLSLLIILFLSPVIWEKQEDRAKENERKMAHVTFSLARLYCFSCITREKRKHSGGRYRRGRRNDNHHECDD